MIRKYIFEYDVEILSGGVRRYFPSVSLSICGTKGQWFRFRPYLDSGADITLLTRSDAELLRVVLNKSEQTRLGGVGGGSTLVTVKNLMVRIGDMQFRMPIAFAHSDEVPRLLGRRILFGRLYVCFDEKMHRASLVERSSAAIRRYGEIFDTSADDSRSS